MFILHNYFSLRINYKWHHQTFYSCSLMCFLGQKKPKKKNTGRLYRGGIQAGRLRVGVSVSPVVWSAVSYVQWCLCSSQTERYRKILQSVGPYHPSDVLCDQSRLVIISKQRSNFGWIPGITLEATVGRWGLLCWQGRATAQIVFPPFHSFCRCICLHLSPLKSNLLFWQVTLRHLLKKYNTGM